MSFSNFAWTQAHRLLGLPEKERRDALRKMRAEFKGSPFMRETEQAMSYINANPEELAKVVPAESKVLRDVVKGFWGELRAVEALALDGTGSKIEKLYDIRKRAAKERRVDGQDRDSLMAIERRVCDVLVELAFKERVLLGRAHVAQQLFEGRLLRLSTSSDSANRRNASSRTRYPARIFWKKQADAWRSGTSPCSWRITTLRRNAPSHRTRTTPPTCTWTI